MQNEWPKPLQIASGPMRRDKLEGAAQGMGRWGAETGALLDEGIVTPDLMTGLTLYLLSSQPREGQKSGQKEKIPGGGGGVAGGVWVRERFTIHQPLSKSEVFRVEGASVGRHVHKGRRYGTTESATYDADGALVASNLTTGLLQYKVQEGLQDTLEGADPETMPAPQPSWEHAADNPCTEQLTQLRSGDVFEPIPVKVGIEMMEARDTKNPDNPIHSDPEQARKAGLSKPIAGGSHVLAFPLELIMHHCGRRCLLYGANFDVRWKAPVYADETIVPHASVGGVSKDRVEFDIDAILESGATAMIGRVIVPLG